MKIKKGRGRHQHRCPLPFSSFACLLVEDQTVKPETPMPMYMPMSMNTFLDCIRSVSYSSI